MLAIPTRLNRQTTYESRKKDVEKWSPYVQVIIQSITTLCGCFYSIVTQSFLTQAMENKHQLRFPLAQSRVVANPADFTDSADKPQTDMEKEIQKILMVRNTMSDYYFLL